MLLRTTYLLFVILFLVGFNQIKADDFIINRVTETVFGKQNIRAIVQDNEGFMWYGSDNGLFRYDGHSVKSFTHEAGNPETLPGNLVRDLHVDQKGNLWVSTFRGGISLFNNRTRTFETFYPKHEDGRINRVEFWNISNSDSNHLWLSPSSQGGIYRFDIPNKTFQKIDIEISDWREETSAMTILEVNPDEIWVGTNFSGIIVINTEGQIQRRYHTNNEGNKRIPSNSILEMYDDGNGFIWVGFYDGGLYQYNKKTGTFSKPQALTGLPLGIFDNVYSIYLEEDGVLWVGTDDGLLLFDTQTMQIHKLYTSQPDLERSLVNNRVRAIFRDKSGVFWVSVEHGGIHRMVRKLRFRHMGYNPDDPNSLTARVVRAIIQKDENTLWVGVHDGGINVVNKHDLSLKGKITHDPNNPRGLSTNNVSAFLIDPDGGIWVGTWGGGLNYYNERTGRFTHYRHRHDDPTTLSDDRIQVLFIDSQNRFWVGTEGGLNLFDRENGTFTRVFQDSNNPPVLSGISLQTQAFVEDEDGVFWIGTWNGLNRYDPSDNSITHYLVDFDRPNWINSNHVISLYDDGEGQLWIGTFGGGLNLLDKKTDTFTQITQNEGLASNVVFAIIPDEYNTVWVSSNNGLTRISKDSYFASNFNFRDGIIGEEFWWGSAYTTPNDEIIFGSTFGFTMFNPSEIMTSNFVPPVVVSSVRVFNQFRPVDSDGVLRLSHNDNYLTIQFASLDFTNTSRIQYAVKLEGLDREWIFTGNRNFATYSNLSGGEYTFRVIATNSHGEWNTEGAALTIIVTPPFWQQSWFFVLALVFFILGITTFIRFRTKQIQVLNKELEKKVEERTAEIQRKQSELIDRNRELSYINEKLSEQKKEIEDQKNTILHKNKEMEKINHELIELNADKNSLIGIVSHDLRSPLSNVLGMIEIMKMEPDMTDDEKNEIFSNLDDLVRRQLRMITKILDIESIEAGKISLLNETTPINDVSQQVCKRFETIAQAKHITLNFYPDTSNPEILADVNYLEQVFENLISNAIKYSPKHKKIEISTEVKQGSVLWSVQDQGPGISEEDRNKLFGKFQRLTAKPTGGETSIGLGLFIVKRYIDAMKGNVWCESSPGKGAKFIIEFPLTGIIQNSEIQNSTIQNSEIQNSNVLR